MIMKLMKEIIILWKSGKEGRGKNIFTNGSSIYSIFDDNSFIEIGYTDNNGDKIAVDYVDNNIGRRVRLHSGYVLKNSINYQIRSGSINEHIMHNDNDKTIIGKSYRKQLSQEIFDDRVKYTNIS